MIGIVLEHQIALNPRKVFGVATQFITFSGADLKMFAIKSTLLLARQALLLTPMLMLLAPARPAQAATIAKTGAKAKQVIGQTALVEETESDFFFPARVDTGATTSSLHVEEWEIDGEADAMAENVGKTIRFRISNCRGESEWLERKIVELSLIQTSEQAEHRYKVPMTLTCLNVKKCVLVSLNDRSHMTYPVLLGRNFLQGDFVVDVDLGMGSDSAKKAHHGKRIHLARYRAVQFALQKKGQMSQETSVPSNGDRNRPSPQKEASSREAQKEVASREAKK